MKYLPALYLLKIRKYYFVTLCTRYLWKSSQAILGHRQTLNSVSEDRQIKLS